AWGVSPRTAAAPCPKAPKGRRQSNVPRKTAVAPSGLLVSWGPANLGLTPIGLHISLSPRRRRGLRGPERSPGHAGVRSREFWGLGVRRPCGPDILPALRSE